MVLNSSGPMSSIDCSPIFRTASANFSRWKILVTPAADRLLDVSVRLLVLLGEGNFRERAKRGSRPQTA